MILWNHAITSPSYFGFMTNTDISYWFFAFILINCFLFIYTYTGHLKNNNYPFMWRSDCFVHSIVENFKFSTISIMLLPKMQHFYLYCLNSNVEYYWIYSKLLINCIRDNDMFVNKNPSILLNYNVTSIQNINNLCKKIHISDNNKYITDIFKLEHYVSVVTDTCNKNHTVIALTCLLIYFLSMWNLLEFFPIVKNNTTKITNTNNNNNINNNSSNNNNNNFEFEKKYYLNNNRQVQNDNNTAEIIEDDSDD